MGRGDGFDKEQYCTKKAELERQGKLKAIVTQNIEGLHHKADSKGVLELHGSCSRYYCLKCGKTYSGFSNTEPLGSQMCFGCPTPNLHE